MKRKTERSGARRPAAPGAAQVKAFERIQQWLSVSGRGVELSYDYSARLSTGAAVSARLWDSDNEQSEFSLSLGEINAPSPGPHNALLGSGRIAYGDAAAVLSGEAALLKVKEPYPELDEAPSSVWHVQRQLHWQSCKQCESSLLYSDAVYLALTYALLPTGIATLLNPAGGDSMTQCPKHCLRLYATYTEPRTGMLWKASATSAVPGATYLK